MRRKATNVPLYARALETRRLALRKTRNDMEAETAGAFHPKMVYRLERGEKHPFSLDLTEFETLLKVLDWTLQDFERETKLSLPPLLRPPMVAGDDGAEPRLAAYSVPLVDAGEALPDWEDAEAMFAVLLPELLHHSEKQLFIVRLSSDSMAPYADEGDRVVFSRGTPATPGDVVAVVQPGSGVSVHRFQGASHDQPLLGHDNPRHIAVMGTRETRIAGVAVCVWRTARA